MHDMVHQKKVRWSGEWTGGRHEHMARQRRSDRSARPPMATAAFVLQSAIFAATTTAVSRRSWPSDAAFLMIRAMNDSHAASCFVVKIRLSRT